jgi:UDP-N-acetylmuramate dehydrogenase
MITNRIREALEDLIQPPVGLTFHEPMAGHTYLGVGGPADAFIVPVDTETLAMIMRVLYGIGMPVHVLGGGTNVVVADEGMDGALVSVREIDYVLETESTPTEATLEVGAGHGFQKLLRYARSAGLSGLENMAGIPGMVGGALAGNAGSFGTSFSDVLVEAIVVNQEGGVERYAKAELLPHYRSMRLPEGSCVAGAVIKLRKDSPDAVAGRMREVLAKKKETQPMGERSAGCVFRNPPGDHAARLIEAVGCKGMAEGGMMVSPLHAGYIVNTGDGTAEEYRELMNIMAERVRGTFGVVLEPEVRLWGRWPEQCDEDED